MTELSPHAAAAKAIRAELKKNGIKAKVRSSSFSMGNSVSVTVFDQTPMTMREIESYCNQFQYGHFDGMQDLYEHSNRREDIPQVKFVSVTNERSESTKQGVWDWMRAYYADFENAPESYAEAGSFFTGHEYGDRAMYRELSDTDSGFWTSRKPRVRA